MKQYQIDQIITENLDKIKEFCLTHITNYKINPTRPYKVATVCPFCHDQRKRYKLVINLDDGFYKCFRCGKSGSLLGIFTTFGVRNEFIAFLSKISGKNQYNITALFKNAIAKKHNNESEEVSDNDALSRKFIADKQLFPINDLQIAYKYALSRVYNDKSEVDTYYADDRYIYVPIITNEKIVSYMARLYVDIENAPRYILYSLDKNEKQIAFYDEVISNINTNSIYITEGYFDSYAINRAMNNYVSICAFGKGKIMSVINDMVDKFPINTTIYLTFDSQVKDKNIVKENITFGKKIIKKFPNLYIVELPDSDPAEILAKNGVTKLKKTLIDYSIPFLKYYVKHSLDR